MLELTLVRHGATALNETSRYQGWTDPPLSPLGTQQAICLARRLRGQTWDAVLCSDRERCTRTAELALPGSPARPDPRLRELHFGAWDGRSYAECLASHPERFRAWIADPTATAPPDGEAFDAFCRRVDAVSASLPRAGRVLIFAHGGPIRRILARVLGLEWAPVARMQISACGLTRVALHDDGGCLLTLNDTAHLRE